MITVTFVRHGESIDNLKNIWAGWKDAPLSNHGMNQAKALGEAFANVCITEIHASPLKRAHSTAIALQSGQLQSPQPILHTDPNLREQHFGVAEGHPWAPVSDTSPKKLDLQRHIYPVLSNRGDSFPEGESLEDLAKRAAQAINEIVVPKVLQAKGKKPDAKDAVYIAIVSHGLCISELIGYLVRRSGESTPSRRYTGLENTAWSRLTVSLEDEESDLGTLEDQPIETIPLKVNVVATNNCDHLVSVVRQKGGIGSAAHDPNQQDIRAFFGGGGIKATQDK